MNQLKLGVVLSYLTQAIQIGLTLLYTPILLRLLGQSQYGIYQIAYSTVGFLSLMSFGFSGSYIRFYAKANAKEQIAVHRLNAAYLIIFSSLAFLVFVLGMFMAYNTDMLLGGKMSIPELAVARKLMYFLVFNVTFNFLIVVFNNFILANERFVVLQLVNFLGILLNPCITYPLLLLNYGSIGMGAALLAITIIQFGIDCFYCLRKLKMKFCFHNIEWCLFKDIGQFSFFIFLESVISTINLSLDRFLLGKFAGSVSAAIYAVGGQINTLYIYLSTSVSSVFVPRINRLVEEKTNDKVLTDLFVKVGRLQFLLLLLVLSGFVIFGQRFIHIWAGKNYHESYWVAVILMIPNTINLIQNIAYEIQRAKNLQKYRSYMWIGIALFNAVISIYLVKLFGASGAALGTAFAWVLGSGFAMNWFYKKWVNLDVKHFWKNIILLAKGGLLPVLTGSILMFFLNNCSLLCYFILMFVYASIYLLSMYKFGLNDYERQLFRNILAKYFDKK